MCCSVQRALVVDHKDARYLDLMERILYNGFLDGVSLKGDRFFYQNPLMSYGNYERFDWINTPCCPPNVVRLIASLGSYIYATADDGLYVNLFAGNRARVAVGGGSVKLRQDTRYPWDGQVRIGDDPDRPRQFTVHVRVPGWAGNQVMPGDLYRFMYRRQDPVVLKINGRTTTAEVVRGFAVIDRTWSAGDAIELTLPMPVRRVVADPRVKDASGRVALERGPLVYNDQNDDVAAVYAGVSPLSSADESNLYFRMRPPVGQPAWVEYTFKKPATITTTDVYFADDRRFCRLPASWRLLYRDGDGWKPVAARQPYEVRTDQFNHVEFEPITATAVRIEIEPVTRHYKSGEIGPPDAMFLNEDIDWRELGVIEWRMK